MFKLKIPMFIRDQIMTHTKLSKVNSSNRVGKSDNLEFYCPVDIMDRLSKKRLLKWRIKYIHKGQQNFINYICRRWSYNKIVKFLKKLGYPKEIYSRYPTQAKYGIMWVGG